MKIVSLANLPDEGVSHDPQLLKKVMINDGEVPFLKKFAQLRMTPGQVAHAHSHQNEYEIFLTETGTGTVKLVDQEFQISSGDCVVFEPTEVHEVINSGSDDMVLTCFGIKAST